MLDLATTPPNNSPKCTEKSHLYAEGSGLQPSPHGCSGRFAFFDLDVGALCHIHQLHHELLALHELGLLDLVFSHILLCLCRLADLWLR